MRARIGVVVTAVALLWGLSLVGGPSAGAAATVSPTGASTRWVTSWSDEFDGAAGTSPDPAKWTPQVTGWSNGNHEKQYYTDSPSNSYRDGQGHLVIEAHDDDASSHTCWYGTCLYTSARLETETTFTQRYGRFEARIKVAQGQGIWPAFWALGADIDTVGWPKSGEIDAMDNGERNVPATAHGGSIGPNSPGCSLAASPSAVAYYTGSQYTLPRGQPLGGGYHLYAADWYPDHVAVSVDGHPYTTVYKADVVAAGCVWPFDKPFYLVLNLAVGGDWPGDPDSTTVFPAKMHVDYVRVRTAKPPAASATGPIVGTGAVNGGKCVDDENWGTADGNPVELWTCNGTTAQRWTLGTDETIRALGKCLDVANSGTAAGTKVQLWTCNGTGAQRWQIESNGTLLNPQSNRCLHAGGSAAGTRLQINDCATAKLTGATWSIPAPRAVTGSWPLNEGSGDTGQDVSDGGLHTLTCSPGVAWPAPTGHGASPRFNGTSQSCDTLDPIVRGPSGFSVGAWVALRATPGAANWTAVSQDGNQLSGFYLGYESSQRAWVFKIPARDSTTTPDWHGASGGPTPAVGTWYHVTGVFDAGTGQVSLYVNGTYAAGATNASSWQARGAFAVGRGMWAGQRGDFFPGDVNGVTVWNYPLTATEVAQAYTSTLSAS